MAVLVTGATGFIGRHLVARLIASGRAVRALVLPDDPDADLLVAPGRGDHGDPTAPVEPAEPVLEIVRGDISNPGDVDAATRGVDRVFHLAAVVYDWGDDAVFHAVNVTGTRNVLAAAARHGCARVVVCSSIAVYGHQLRTGVCDERTARREWGVGPYSRSKRAAEELALDYHAFGRVPVTVVRPGNVYGPGSGLWVDALVRLLRAGRGVLRVVLIDRGDGDAALTYVGNAVDVIVRAAYSDAAAGAIYNVNDGSGVTWREYTADLARIAGVAPPTRSVPAGVALALAAAMETGARLARRTERPLLTREAVALLSSRRPVPIRRAVTELDYQPVPYRDALAGVAAYIHGGTI